MASWVTKFEQLIQLLSNDCKEVENAKAVGEKLWEITDTHEEQVAEILKIDEAVTAFIGLMFDISSLHPEQAYYYWHVLSKQYRLCQKHLKAGCMQVRKWVARTNRTLETLAVFEAAFQKNDLQMLKLLTGIRSLVEKDAMWPFHYDDKSDYAQPELGKIKLFIDYISAGSLNDDMLMCSLNDLLLMMMGQDALKHCFSQPIRYR